MKKYLYDDLANKSLLDKINLEKLWNKTILITGATGLIGQALVISLLHYSKSSNKHIRIIACVRNLKKATDMYAAFGNSDLKFLVGDITEEIICDERIDYIIHAASVTSSKMFVENPVEVINIAITGMKNVLELAKEKKVNSVVYLSSMEVYGSPETNEKIDESFGTNIDTMKVRSSYPESKRMCEALCTAYFSEYNVPVKVARLTQTFGPGVDYNDGRVFAEFARCVVEGRDIVLHTKGETKRNYLYTLDAVTAILTILLKGDSCEAYNVANEDTYCSIYEMAEMVATECSDGNIRVKVMREDIGKFGYAPTLKMNLDTSKLKSLGWKPSVDLREMYKNLLCVFGK